jgi:hypothetical protein
LIFISLRLEWFADSFRGVPADAPLLQFKPQTEALMNPIRLLAILALSLGLSTQAAAQSQTMLMTVFLRHDQTKTVDEINAHLDKTGFRKNFPPEGVEIVSYNIVMGIGHVITLRLPADKLRAVNLAIERGAWGAFRSEFYPTYDYLQIYQGQRAEALKK